MELCWSCGEKKRQPLDKPHSFWMPRDTQRTEEDQGRDGRTAQLVSLNTGTVSRVVPWRSMAKAYAVQRQTFNG